MSFKQALLKEIHEKPLGFRELLKESEVEKALSDIGVLPKILELHAPAEGSRKTNGLGKTLCGIKGTRHSKVTCKRCLNKM